MVFVSDLEETTVTAALDVSDWTWRQIESRTSSWHKSAAASLNSMGRAGDYFLATCRPPWQGPSVPRPPPPRAGKTLILGSLTINIGTSEQVQLEQVGGQEESKQMIHTCPKGGAVSTNYIIMLSASNCINSGTSRSHDTGAVSTPT